MKSVMECANRSLCAQCDKMGLYGSWWEVRLVHKHHKRHTDDVISAGSLSLPVPFSSALIGQQPLKFFSLQLIEPSEKE